MWKMLGLLCTHPDLLSRECWFRYRPALNPTLACYWPPDGSRNCSSAFPVQVGCSAHPCLRLAELANPQLELTRRRPLFGVAWVG